MADSLNGNAIHTQYGHFKNGGRQWSTHISGNCLTGFGNGLAIIVEVLARRRRFAQDVPAVSHYSRQGPDG